MRALILNPVLFLALLLPCFAGLPDAASFRASEHPPTSEIRPDDAAEYKKMRKEAGKDVAKLWKLVNWCEARGMTKEWKSCLRAIVKEEPDDEKARELLGHIFYDGKWFKTQKKLDKYKKDEAKKKAAEMEKVAKEKGLVRFGDEWVEPQDLPYLEKGWVKNEYGEWVDPVAAKRLEEGWVQQDLVWVSPDEKANIDKGLWKCGDAWLNEADADEYHSELMQWWEIPTDYYVLRTTCARKHTKDIIQKIDETYRDLMRFFGVGPVGKPTVVVLSSIDQYNVLAAGDDFLGIQGTELLGWSSANPIFFADFWFTEEGQFDGSGVTYWNADDKNDVLRANHWVRHAAAQSFIDAIDRSRETFEDLKSGNMSGERYASDFWREKALPNWVRWGAAAYVERYYVDRFSDDKFWPRTWSVSNILNKGGMDPVGTIVEFEISLESEELATQSTKLFNEAGLLVAAILDAKNAELMKAHGAFKQAFKKYVQSRSKETKRDVEKAVRALGEALRNAEGDIKTFAGV